MRLNWAKKRSNVAAKKGEIDGNPPPQKKDVAKQSLQKKDVTERALHHHKASAEFNETVAAIDREKGGRGGPRARKKTDGRETGTGGGEGREGAAEGGREGGREGPIN